MIYGVSTVGKSDKDGNMSTRYVNTEAISDSRVKKASSVAERGRSHTANSENSRKEEVLLYTEISYMEVIGVVFGDLKCGFNLYLRELRDLR